MTLSTFLMFTRFCVKFKNKKYNTEYCSNDFKRRLFFLFSVVDAIFVSRDIGLNALGAMNLIAPFILIFGAINMLISIGSVSIFAVRIGRGDVEGANKVFRHGMLLMLCVSVIFSFAGVFFTDSICKMFGADETFHQFAVDYLFWYSVFIIPYGTAKFLP